MGIGVDDDGSKEYVMTSHQDLWPYVPLTDCSR